ncbi:MAG: hypothetical protein VX745_08095 [Pseudomonadota bacterium]|nr:hypothetical protein [Pseudomonadota bacterium]
MRTSTRNKPSTGSASHAPNQEKSLSRTAQKLQCSAGGCQGCGSIWSSPRYCRLLPVAVCAIIGGYLPSLLNIPYEPLSDLVTVIGTALGIAVAVILMRMDTVQEVSDGF